MAESLFRRLVESTVRQRKGAAAAAGGGAKSPEATAAFDAASPSPPTTPDFARFTPVPVRTHHTRPLPPPHAAASASACTLGADAISPCQGDGADGGGGSRPARATSSPQLDIVRTSLQKMGWEQGETDYSKHEGKPFNAVDILMRLSRRSVRARPMRLCTAGFSSQLPTQAVPRSQHARGRDVVQVR